MLGSSARRRAARRAAPPLALVALAAVVLAGCGGGSKATAGEPSRSYDVKVSAASFPAIQSVAKPERLELTVLNTGNRTIPDVSVSLDSLNYASNYPGLAARQRPIWVIERGPGKSAEQPVESQEVSIPGGGQTAYVNTWALGALRANGSETFAWKVVPVKSGTFTVHYTIAAGLAGRARAKLASGGPASGRFEVKVAPAPAVTHVDPRTGKVVQGEYPAAP